MDERTALLFRLADGTRAIVDPEREPVSGDRVVMLLDGEYVLVNMAAPKPPGARIVGGTVVQIMYDD